MTGVEEKKRVLTLEKLRKLHQTQQVQEKRLTHFQHFLSDVLLPIIDDEWNVFHKQQKNNYSIIRTVWRRSAKFQHNHYVSLFSDLDPSDSTEQSKFCNTRILLKTWQIVFVRQPIQNLPVFFFEQSRF